VLRQEYVDYGTDSFRGATSSGRAARQPQQGNYSMIAEELPGALENLLQDLTKKVTRCSPRAGWAPTSRSRTA